MAKSKRKAKKGKALKIAAGAAVLLAAVAYYFLFTAMSKTGEKHYIFIDDNDNIDSVYTKLEKVSTSHSLWAFRQMERLTSYADKIRTGRYQIGNEGALQTFRHLRNGYQAPVNITIKSVRTINDLAKEIDNKLMFSKADLLNALTSKETCKKYGFTPETIISMFIPNTYEFYWNTSIDKFMDKMAEEYKKFWTFERVQKAKSAGFQQSEVVTLASIVDEETDSEGEMPMIAGMYINRLHQDMLLQADPTVKFATKNFEAHRIYHKWLSYDSPYNTYKYKGLPPGPIRIPCIAAIDAVLDYVHHDYVYMCAKEDFSGTHNFAKTYEEHLKNAEKYAKALNERGIQ
ncbi:endolytic transglycosylase MltG [Prevotella sp. HUN102]|uniref:endolytic transglycosylase MltG n=1 Tax=Prevotella sp. HUN102 TaxID=1392486 RepID=UPI00048BE2EE|nr:endolytic transglycosylase MltG [Prevotella sp. HUN102]